MAAYLSSNEREAISRGRVSRRARKSATTLLGFAPATPGHRGLVDHLLQPHEHIDPPYSTQVHTGHGLGLGLGLSLGPEASYGSVTLQSDFHHNATQHYASSSVPYFYEPPAPHHSSYPPSPKLAQVSLPDVSRTCTPQEHLHGHAGFVPTSSSLRTSIVGEMIHDEAIGIMVPTAPAHSSYGDSALGIYHAPGDFKRRREVDGHDDRDLEERDVKRARGQMESWLPPYQPRFELPPPPAPWVQQQQQCWRSSSALTTPPYMDMLSHSFGSPERKLSSSSSSNDSSPSDYFSHASQHSDVSTLFSLLTPHETPRTLPKQELTIEQEQQQHAAAAKESAANARASFDKPDKSIRLLSQALKEKLVTRELGHNGSTVNDDDEEQPLMVTPSGEHVSALRTVIPAMTCTPLRHPSSSMSGETTTDDALGKVLREDFTLADVDASIILQCIARDEGLIQKEKENPGSASHIGKFRDREEEKGAAAPSIASQPEGKGKKNGALRSLQPGICHNCGIDEVSEAISRDKLYADNGPSAEDRHHVA